MFSIKAFLNAVKYEARIMHQGGIWTFGFEIYILNIKFEIHKFQISRLANKNIFKF